MNAKSTIKVANRYAALAEAAEADGVSFERSKRPTSKECEELSALIEAHRANGAQKSAPESQINKVEASETAGSIEMKVDSEEMANTAATKGTEERLIAIEAKREEARRKFSTATKATTAHGYALIAAATADGDKMENMRAKLAEMNESIRAEACRLAFRKLVPAGSDIQASLKALHDEQPAASRKARGEKKTGGGGVVRTRRKGSNPDGYIRIFIPSSLSKFGDSWNVTFETRDGKPTVVVVLAET